MPEFKVEDESKAHLGQNPEVFLVGGLVDDHK
jgi:hypothetical protein